MKEEYPCRQLADMAKKRSLDIPSAGEIRSAIEQRAGTMYPVWASYRIENERIVGDPASGVARSFLPYTSPGLLSDFLRVRPRDEESTLEFVHEWGLLGHGKSWPGSPPGDPLVWVWAHAHGVGTAQGLLRRLRRGATDDEIVEFLSDRHLMKSARSEFLRVRPAVARGGAPKAARVLFDRWETSDDLEPMVQIADNFACDLFFGERRGVSLIGWGQNPGERMSSVAMRIVLGIVGRNIEGVYQGLRGSGIMGTDPPVTYSVEWDDTISMVYHHLAEIITSERVRECAAEDCGALIDASYSRRFCPGSEEEGESGKVVKKRSRCEMRQSKRDQRRPDGGTKS